MTLEEVRRKNSIGIAGAAKVAAEKDRPLHYIFQCLARFYRGDYGVIPPEDIAANNAELAAGEGRIIGKYQAAEGLKEDIFIIAYFSDQHVETDYNYTTILYTSDY